MAYSCSKGVIIFFKWVRLFVKLEKVVRQKIEIRLLQGAKKSYVLNTFCVIISAVYHAFDGPAYVTVSYYFSYTLLLSIGKCHALEKTNKLCVFAG